MRRSRFFLTPSNGERSHLGIVLPVIAMMAVACGERPEPPAIGEPVPEVVLPDLEGRTVRLSDFRGEVVVLNFWATWCPPCVDEMPSLERLYQALKDKGLRVLAVSVDESLEDVEEFRETYDLTLPILHDRGGKVSRSFFTFKYPETYIVDRDGRLQSKVIGPRDWIAPAVIRDFVQMLQQGQAGSSATLVREPAHGGRVIRGRPVVSWSEAVHGSLATGV